MNAFFSEFATTGARIALSLMLWLITVLVALTGMLLGRIDAKALTTLDHIGVGLLIAMGVDVVQYIGKRVTFDAEAHATPLREDTRPARDVPLTPPAVAAPALAAQAAATPAIAAPEPELPQPPTRAALIGRPSHAG